MIREDFTVLLIFSKVLNLHHFRVAICVFDGAALFLLCVCVVISASCHVLREVSALRQFVSYFSAQMLGN